MLRESDCVRDRIRTAIPEPTEWQYIGDQIDAAFMFARSDFVNVHQSQRRKLVFANRKRDSGDRRKKRVFAF
jgi:hypothetical protein